MFIWMTKPELGEVVALGHEVVPEVEVAFDVLVEPRDLRVGDEDHAVDALQHELAARVVVALARHGVEVEAGLHALDRAQAQGQEVEVEGALLFGGDARRACRAPTG